MHIAARPGVLEAIVNVMEKHMADDFVSAAAAMAVGGLAKDDINRDTLGEISSDLPHSSCV